MFNDIKSIGLGTGFVALTYMDDKKNEYVDGYREVNPIKKEMVADAIFDIASITKFFTAILIYKAMEEGKLNFDDLIINIEPKFQFLNDVRIRDLLSHRYAVWTNGYLGNAKDKDDFYRIIYTSYVKEKKRKELI